MSLDSTDVPLGIELVKDGVNVLVEKPMSTDILSGRLLVAAGAESKAKILVGQHRRFVRSISLHDPERSTTTDPLQ